MQEPQAGAHPEVDPGTTIRAPSSTSASPLATTRARSALIPWTRICASIEPHRPGSSTREGAVPAHRIRVIYERPFPILHVKAHPLTHSCITKKSRSTSTIRNRLLRRASTLRRYIAATHRSRMIWISPLPARVAFPIIATEARAVDIRRSSATCKMIVLRGAQEYESRINAAERRAANRRCSSRTCEMPYVITAAESCAADIRRSKETCEMILLI